VSSVVAEPDDDQDDPALACQISGARPELDPIRIEVLRASAAAALFGALERPRIARYELLREVGTGGGGSVFVARDPELAREIALKLIPASDPALRARAVAEGQALAQLAHPNVVAVFDVGVAGDRVYLAMELVRGESLRAYARRATPRERVRAYRQACEGLIAAHAVGLVHRDFKPDNAMIGADGRVRIVDFGLAGADGGAVRAGTPAYMAPEQRAGDAATAAVDQFAFAVALREAFAGAPPRWLVPVLRRATSAEPAARFPSMTTLSRALADDPPARWRRRALIGLPLAILALAAGGFVVGRAQQADAPTCDAVAALAPAWTAERAIETRLHALGLDSVFARASGMRAGDALDAYATAWRAAYRGACVAARTEPSAQLVARRATCLAGARSRLAGAIDVLRASGANDLDGALRAAVELPSLDRCANVAELVDDIPAPEPSQVALVAGLRAAIDRVRAAVDAGRADAATAAAATVASARALGYRPLLAQALLVEGHALDAVGRRRDGVTQLGEAVDLAIPMRDDATAVEAYARLIRASGGDALAGIQPVLGLAERLRQSDPFAVGLLHNNAGVAELAAGHVDRAREEWRAALQVARAVTAAGAVELAWVRTNLALVLDPGAERDALLAEAVSVTRDRLGDDHPHTLRIAIAAAFARPGLDAARTALRAPCERLAELHPQQRALIVECGYELARLELDAGDSDAARGHFARVATISRGKDVDLNRIAVAAAFARMLAGDRQGARAALDRLATKLQPDATTRWYELIVPADVELGRALLGDRTASARAVAYLERAARTSTVLAITRRLDALRVRARR